MNECANAHELMAGFVDGELAVEQSAWLDGHLASCDECRAELARFAAVDGELTGWGRQLSARNPPPPDARAQLVVRMVSRTARPRAIRWVLAAAAAMAIAAGYKVAADPNAIVPADVLVGEDGRAHAVRVLGDIHLN